MAFSNGGALVVGERDTPRFGNDLAQYLARAGVTYFSTVPTMLSTMTEDIPSLAASWSSAAKSARRNWWRAGHARRGRCSMSMARPRRR